MNARLLAAVLCFALVASACEDELAGQLKTLQGLLQSRDFAVEMASHLDGAYYRGLGQAPPPFLTPQDETATVAKSAKEEKIAINLAGFYAVEAGLGVISERTQEAPTDILDTLAAGTRSPGDMLLVARFANATWKAGQPFRSLSRISRPNFIPVALLSDDEVKKDFVQIRAAARRLGDALQSARGQARPEQLRRLQALLQDREFAQDIAAYLDAAYYGGQRQTPPPFLTPQDETAMLQKSVKEEKIAINLAGFYAVEVGATVIATRTREMPSAVLASIVDGSRPQADMLLLARFANATWKAGQPFRSLSRISRPAFIPAALLSEDELKKDFDQIRAASAKLLEAMRRN